jgi:anthranilate phosphoribosyltransferase
VLELLGANLALGPGQCAEAIDKGGFAFLFAPNFHPAMKTVAPVRKQVRYTVYRPNLVEDH